MGDEFEIDFFADEDTAEDTAGDRRLQSGASPRELIRRRRVAAAFIASIIVLIVVVVVLTQASSGPSGAYRTYLARLSPIAGDSARTGSSLVTLMSQMRAGTASNPLATLGELATRARTDLARAEQINPPAQLREEHQQALMALGFRVEGMQGLHDAIGEALGSTTSSGETAIANKIDSLTTSDVLWAYRVWQPISALLARLRIQGLTAPRSQFITDINASSPDSIAALVHARTATGAVLKLGSSGPAVATWQKQLNRWLKLKHEKQITSDGNFGPGTQTATEALQRAQGLSPDGTVGPRTRQALAAGLAAGARPR